MTRPINSHLRLAMIVLAVALVAIGTWYVASPHWTLWQMRSAARDGDADKLASYVDFPELRTSMKEEFKAQFVKQVVDPKLGGMQSFGAAFALPYIDHAVDAMVTPAGMRAIFDTAKQNEKLEAPNVNAGSPDLDIERDGLSRFVAQAPPQGDKAGGHLTFVRHGFGWKLSALTIVGAAK